MVIDVPGLDGQDPAAYGERTAKVYDQLYADAFDTAAAVDTLADLTADGTLLDLGSGTGRLLVPLTKRGVRAEGIEASGAMTGRLRTTPTGSGIVVHVGDFVDVEVPGRYRVIVCAVSTLFMLVDQQAQLRCFANVAAHLEEGGVFVVEAFVPDPRRYDNQGRRSETRHVDDRHLHVVTSHHDPLEQRIDLEHILVDDGVMRRYPVTLRYAWPAELDVMAATVGLARHTRWGDWRHEPVTALTTDHITVYRPETTPARETEWR